MALLGRANWWAPRFMRRREEAAPTRDLTEREPELASLH
jgi:hypothetical protein